MEINTCNTNTLAPAAYATLQAHGRTDVSRNGPVLRLDEPLTIRIAHPRERVNFCPARDANPFFHLIEACAILAEENNIQFLAYFAKQMLEYSDDGRTQNAFYGTRLRSTFGLDQLNAIIHNLLEKPNSRQEVALMWSPPDLVRNTKDKACNLLLMFAIDHRNNVTMTSVNRSNDAIWGMVNGANVVHLSVIHEYVARSVDRMMGPWWHFSNNFHVYTDNPKWAAIRDLPVTDLYRDQIFHITPLFCFGDQKNAFDFELRRAVSRMVVAVEDHVFVKPDGFEFLFVRDAVHMFNAWQAHKLKVLSFNSIMRDSVEHIRSGDWKLAAERWLRRRHDKHLQG